MWWAASGCALWLIPRVGNNLSPSCPEIQRDKAGWLLQKMANES